jgi:uncharacterized protein with HEPN domain
MSKRDDSILLEDLLEAIENVNAYTEGMTLDIFLADRKTKDAVARNFEVMGEAVGRMNPEFKSLHTQINWKDVKEFRNILIHAYEIIDYSLVWTTIQKELPALYTQAKDLLNKLK